MMTIGVALTYAKNSRAMDANYGTALRQRHVREPIICECQVYSIE